MQEALQALRSVPALVPKDLAARTQLRVRLRAQEVSRDEEHVRRALGEPPHEVGVPLGPEHFGQRRVAAGKAARLRHVDG